MASSKVWNLKYVAGNPSMFSEVTTSAGGPMSRKEALDGAETINKNGGGWRFWVEHVKTAERILESDAEKSFQASQLKNSNRAKNTMR